MVMQPIQNALGKAQSFIFGAGTDTPTYEALKKKREIADLLGVRAMTAKPQNVNEGIGAIVAALGSKISDRRLAPKEDAERQRASTAMQDIIASLGGGGGGGQTFTPSMGGSAAPAGMSAPLQGDMAGRVRQGLLQRGLPEHVADGFLMNFQDESGLNPGINEQNPIVPGSRGGFGLAQWTGPRREALEQRAAQTGRPLDDIDLQLDHLVAELQGPEAKAGQAIMSARDPGSAAAAIASEFLRPAPEHLQRRVAEYTGRGGMPMGGGAPAPNMDAIAQISELLSNPYLPEGQKALGQALLQQQIGNMDPARAMQMQRAQQELQLGQMEIDNYGRPQPVAPTDDMREYELAKSQGFQGSFIEFVTEQKKAGATNVTTNVAGQEVRPDAEFYKKLDEVEGTAFGAILESAPQIGRAAGNIAILEEQLSNVTTGGVANWQRVAGEFGINTDGLSEIQAVEATINALVPEQRPPGTGPMSDADLALFKQSLPRLINQPGGNQIIVAKLKAINAYDQQIAEIAGRVASREMTRDDARKAMMAIPNPLDGYKAEVDAFSGPAAGGGDGPAKVNTMQEFEALPSGTTFIAPDGSRRIKP